jgi:ribosomal protein L35
MKKVTRKIAGRNEGRTKKCRKEKRRLKGTEN